VQAKRITMTDVKRSWDVLSAEERQAALTALIDYFATERDEKLGIIAAEELLDVFLQQVGTTVYNHGVDAATQLFKAKVAELDADIAITVKK